MEKAQAFWSELLFRAHEALLGKLQELENLASKQSASGSEGLHTLLTDVRHFLGEHFRFEEQNGYMSTVLKEKPFLERSVQKLYEEHGQLRQALDALITETDVLNKREAVLRERIQRWVKEVRHHESKENELVEDAFNQEVLGEG